MTRLRRSYALSGLAVVTLAVVGWWVLRGRAVEVRYVTAAVDRGDVRDVVGATGTLQAVTTVQVGSQVSGTIQSLYADFNSMVRKGQVLARLDPSLLQARLGQVQAALISAQANVERSRATVEDARQKLARAEKLFAEQLLPQADLETARATHAEAVAALKGSQAAVTQAAANVRQAQVDMQHTVIATPIDGVVVARNVDVGQTVAASLQAPVLFVIANDLSRLQVNASIDEADVGRVHAGQEATFRVDAFPSEVFTGKVEQVRLQPITVQNVVTYTTIIGVDNPGQRLMPGMTATVSVVVERGDGVLRIPASALRFRREGFEAPAGRTGSPAGGGAAAGGGTVGGGAAGAGRRQRTGSSGGAPTAGDGRSPSANDASPSPASPAPPGARGAGGSRPAIVFVLDASGAPQPVRIRAGISDGQFVEVATGLTEGQAVITGIAGDAVRGATPRAGASPAANPFAPAPPQRRSR